MSIIFLFLCRRYSMMTNEFFFFGHLKHANAEIGKNIINGNVKPKIHSIFSNVV